MKNHTRNPGSVHQLTGQMTDSVVKESALEQSFDNLTVVIISFRSLEKYYNDRPEG